MVRAICSPEIASWPSCRHQPPLVSAGSAKVTEPPDWGFPDVVGVVVVLPPPALLPPLPLLEHAAAVRAKTRTTAAMVEWWRARSLVATFPPAVECRH